MCKNEYKDYINLTEAFKTDLTRLYVHVQNLLSVSCVLVWAN